MKKIAVVLLFGIFLAFKVEATMAAFIVVETGLSPEMESNQHSERWEDVMMDIFFEEGFIVSNVPIIRFDRMPQGRTEDILATEFDYARDGGADFIVIARLDYVQGTPEPQMVTVSLFSIHYVRIYEKQIDGMDIRTTSVRDEVNDIRAVIRDVLPYVRSLR